MTVGSLNSLAGTYTYFRRGTTRPLFPDLAPDRGGDCGEIAFSRGSLFAADKDLAVGWKLTTLYDIGVDVVIDLNQSCFVDRVVLLQDAAGGGCAAVEVFAAADDAEFRVAGVLRPADSESLVIPVGLTARRLLLRLHADFKNVLLRQVRLFGCTLDAPLVYPFPAQVQFSSPSATLPLSQVSAIVAVADAAGDVHFAAERLAETIAEDHGVTLPLQEHAAAGSDSLPCIHLALEKAPTGAAQPGKDLQPEGYVLTADTTGVHITARDRRGLVYGVETLLGLLRTSDGLPAIPACRISDHPAMAFRGVHLGLPPRSEIPFIKRLIRYLFVPMRINTMFIEFAGGMRFDRRPEINEAWIRENARAAEGKRPPVAHGTMVAGGDCLSKDEVRDLVDYASAFGLEVIPEVQSLSHVQYLTMAYPDIGEVEEAPDDSADIDVEKEDKKPAAINPHCYCPSLEKSYDIIFDVIDEIVEVVQPTRYVHMGHDEVYVIGVCPRCKNTPPADLLARHLKRMYDHLAEKGLGMMIWSDMLQPCTAYKTPPAIDLIPKDIVMLDFIWYFHMDKDLEDNLLKKDFQVVMGNMYSSHYPRYEARRLKPGMIGAQVSTWVRPDEYTLAREGKLYDLLYSGNMMWSADYQEALRLTYDRIISGMLPRIRSRLHGSPYPSLLPDAAFTPLSLGGLENTLESLLPSGRTCFRGVPFTIGTGAVAVQGEAARAQRYPGKISLTVGQAFDSLVFLHAALGNAERIPWKDLVQVGEYHIEFEDGETLVAAIEYGGNIADIGRRHATPLPHAMYRHEGYIGTYLADPFVQEKDDEGNDVTVYGYEWLNPRPGKVIRSLHLLGRGETDAGVALFALTGVSR